MGIPAERINGVIPGNDRTNFFVATDVQPAIAGVGGVVTGNDLGLIAGENQVAPAVIFPVLAVWLCAFNDGCVVVSDVPASDIQRFSVLGGDLPLFILL